MLSRPPYPASAERRRANANGCVIFGHRMQAYRDEMGKTRRACEHCGWEEELKLIRYQPPEPKPPR